MFNSLRSFFKRYLKEEAGAALILALILVAIGSLMLVPLLSFVGSGFKTTDQVYDRQANELYAADSGVRDAMRRIIDSSCPPTPYSLDNPVNNKNVQVTISPVVKDNIQYYKIFSEGQSGSGQMTTITAIINSFSLRLFTDKVLASPGDTQLQPGTTATGDAWISGDLTNHGEIIGSLSTNPIEGWPPASIFREFYGQQVAGALSDPDEKIWVNETPVLGPLHQIGDLHFDNGVADSKITLNGTIYVDGSLYFDQPGNKNYTIDLNNQAIFIEGDFSVASGKVDIKGPGVIIAIGNIDYQPAATSGGGYIYIMSVEGSVTALPRGDFNGTFAARTGIYLQPDSNIDWLDGPPENLNLPPYTTNDVTIGDIISWEINSASSIINVTPSLLQGGDTGIPYPAKTFIATGGTPPYTWSITSGSLPPGLSLVNNVLSGTPTTTGIYPFTITATDSAGKIGSQELSIKISNPPDITTAALPDGKVGVSYVPQTLAVTDGTAPYTWSIVGALPPGLELDDNTIKGLPTTDGDFSFTVKVIDAIGAEDTQALTITINPGLTITTALLPDGNVGLNYNQTLAAENGTEPYSWSLVGGSLPDGLSLDSAGNITGTPSSSDEFSFTVQVNDSAGGTATKPLSITIDDELMITTPSLPDGKKKQPYSATITAIGGTTPYTWSITSGALPGGLSLNASTGVISGTLPNTPNVTYSFTVTVTDSASPSVLCSKVLSILVTN